MLRLRIVSLSLASLICASIIVYAVTAKFEAITDLFDDTEAIKVEVEKKEKPPPPPPPPPDRPPPPPPPQMQVINPDPEAPPEVTYDPITPDPPPPPAPPAPAIITNPTWLERPDARDFARYYPERALERERTGRVILNCIVASDGRIACTVAQEDPSGWGFGDAALRISRHFRMSPRLEDGRPTEGGRVRVPITFRLG